MACERTYVPKPRAYPRIIYPEKSYQHWQNEACPLAFDYPKYAKVVRDSMFFEEKIDNPCWFNIVFPDFGATIHCSYKSISDKNNLVKLLEDAHKLTAKHIIKAEYIDEQLIQKPQQHVYGLFSDVGGNAASSVQFYLTDSTEHFLRGALYFSAAPNYDSLRPVIDFLKTDIFYFFDTFTWNN